MQNIFIPTVAFFSVIILSCSSDKTEEMTTTESDKAATEKTTLSPAELPYIASYSSSFEMGSPQNSLTILEFWKAWDHGDIGMIRDLFSDTVSLNFKDGTYMSGSRDSVIAGIQKLRNRYLSVQSRVASFFPIKSIDNNEDWVCIWGTRIMKSKSGKLDSVYLQETWRVNKDGKTDYMSQCGAVAVSQ